MKYKPLCTAAIFFMTIFYRPGGAWPPWIRCWSSNEHFDGSSNESFMRVHSWACSVGLISVPLNGVHFRTHQGAHSRMGFISGPIKGLISGILNGTHLRTHENAHLRTHESAHLGTPQRAHLRTHQGAHLRTPQGTHFRTPQ